MAGQSILSAFDTLDWAHSDHLTTTATMSDSPELVPVQPKVYNTVGTEKKTATPQFAAPNRIQREGSIRRTYGLQNRAEYAPREPPQQLHMQTSMQYAQQLSNSYSQHGFTTNSAPFLYKTHQELTKNIPDNENSSISGSLFPAAQRSTDTAGQGFAQPMAASLPNNSNSYSSPYMQAGNVVSGAYSSASHQNISPTVATTHLYSSASQITNSLASTPSNTFPSNVPSTSNLSSMRAIAYSNESQRANAHPISPTTVNSNKPTMLPSATVAKPIAVAETATTEEGCMTAREESRIHKYVEQLNENSPDVNSGPIPGLQKMQTLQRLAQFPNPMQNIAQNRLHQFSLKAALNFTIPSPQDPSSAVNLLLESKKNPVVPNKLPVQAGELNLAYQFPPPGITNETPDSLHQSALQDNKVNPPPRGPLPLTAGPPGQRQNHGLSMYRIHNGDQLWEQNQIDHALRTTHLSKPKPIEASIPDISCGSGGGWSSEIADTENIESIAKYYPNGFGAAKFSKPIKTDPREDLAWHRGYPLTREEKVQFDIELARKSMKEDGEIFGKKFEPHGADPLNGQARADNPKAMNHTRSPTNNTSIKPTTTGQTSCMGSVEHVVPKVTGTHATMTSSRDNSFASLAIRNTFGTNVASFSFDEGNDDGA